MRENLDKAHKQFRVGTSMLLAGTLLSIGGAAITSDPGSSMEKVKTGVMITGGVLALAGAIFMIDSHRYIGKAGRWTFSGDTITYDIK